MKTLEELTVLFSDTTFVEKKIKECGSDVQFITWLTSKQQEIQNFYSDMTASIINEVEQAAYIKRENVRLNFLISYIEHTHTNDIKLKKILVASYLVIAGVAGYFIFHFSTLLKKYYKVSIMNAVLTIEDKKSTQNPQISLIDLLPSDLSKKGVEYVKNYPDTSLTGLTALVIALGITESGYSKRAIFSSLKNDYNIKGTEANFKANYLAKFLKAPKNDSIYHKIQNIKKNLF